MNPMTLVPMLAQAAGQQSPSNFWIPIGIVIAIIALFVGLVVYAARRSRIEGRHPQMDEED